MMTELKEFVTELTGLTKELRTALAEDRRKNQGAPVPSAAEAPLAQDVPKPRAPRKPKEEKSPTPPLEPVVGMTEEESTKAMYALAKTYVERFQHETPDGRVRASSILREKFGGVSAAALNHSQRVQFVSMLRTDLDEAK